MNISSWLVVAAAMAALPLAACTVNTTPTGSGGGTATATATATTVTTTGAGGAGSCTGTFPMGSCSTCGEASCCAEGAACDATTGCIACVYSSDPACTSANKAAADALVACLHASCEDACFTKPVTVDTTCAVPAPAPLQGACVTVGGKIECNPVTNEFCDAAKGESCDFNGDGYHCYQGPNERSLCEACGPTNGAGSCKAGSTCLPGPDGKCGRFCCDNSDCGAGKCDKSGMYAGSVGVCLGGNP